MAFPVDAAYESRSSGSTIVKSAWANASDAALNGVIGGSKSVTRLTVDGLGYYTSGLAASGSILAMSGKITAGGDIQTSGGVVVGTKVASTGTVGVELRSGTGVMVFQAAASRQVNSGGLVDVLYFPLLSGRVAEVLVQAVGSRTTSGMRVQHTFAGGLYNYAGTSNTDGSAVDLHYSSTHSGLLSASFSASLSGQAGVAVLSMSGQAINWTVHATVTQTQ